MRRCAQACVALTDPLQRAAAILAVARVEPMSRVLVLASLVARREISIANNPYNFLPEIAALYGREFEAAGDIATRESPPTLATLRRIARAARWSSLTGLAKAVIRPEILAISHGPMLADQARKSDLAVGFVHAETLLDKGRQVAGEVVAGEGGDILAVLLDALAPRRSDGPWQDWLRVEIRRAASLACDVAMRDMRGLLSLEGLPSRCWSGTGGHYPARAVGLAVVERGGKMLRFAHGGALSLLDIAGSVTNTEFVSSTHVMFETEATAELVRRSDCASLIGRERKVEVLGGKGDPFMVMPMRGIRNARRPRVAYVPTCFFGRRVPPIPTPPDVFYLDLQLRIVAALKNESSDFVVQPHPEGVLSGARHPLGLVSRISDQRFEDIVNSIDAFVFDYPASTTFAQALCTDKPIVVLDLWGENFFCPTMRRRFAERCRFVQARQNERGQVEFQPGALTDAVFGGPRQVDGSFWRGLLGNEREIRLDAAPQQVHGQSIGSRFVGN